MAVKIRLKRMGKIRAPYYRIVVAASRTAVEREGYSGMWVWETRHDPFLQCLQASMATAASGIIGM